MGDEQNLMMPKGRERITTNGIGTREPEVLLATPGTAKRPAIKRILRN
jgi:hypothetical protein